MIGKVILSSFLVKSPEIASQSSPLLSDFHTRYEAKYKRAGLCGLTKMGASQLKRSCGSPAPA